MRRLTPLVLRTSPSSPNLGRFGSFGRGVTPEQAKDIEALGYGAVWVGGSPPAELDWVEPILEKTTTLQVATGIVNIGPRTPNLSQILPPDRQGLPRPLPVGHRRRHPEAGHESASRSTR